MIRRKSLNSTLDVVLDEADDAFKVSKIKYTIFFNLCKKIQSVIVSATLPIEVLNITDKFMKDPTRILMKVEKLSLECITQYYVAIHDDFMKYDVLKDLYSSISVSQSIIYCNSVNRVMNLYDAMNEQGFLCVVFIVL